MSGLLEKTHLPYYICLGTFIGQSLQMHLIDCFNQSSRCLIFMGVSYSSPVISSGDAQKEADGFNLKREGKNFLVILLLPPSTQHSLPLTGRCFNWGWGVVVKKKIQSDD